MSLWSMSIILVLGVVRYTQDHGFSRAGGIWEYAEIVIAGSVGSGKSFTSDLLIAYSLYELSCLKDPQNHYGLADGSPISILQQSITEAKARKVLFTQISTLIRRSKYFEERFRYDPSIKSALIFPGISGWSP